MVTDAHDDGESVPKLVQCVTSCTQTNRTLLPGRAWKMIQKIQNVNHLSFKDSCISTPAGRRIHTKLNHARFTFWSAAAQSIFVNSPSKLECSRAWSSSHFVIKWQFFGAAGSPEATRGYRGGKYSCEHYTHAHLQKTPWAYSTSALCFPNRLLWATPHIVSRLYHKYLNSVSDMCVGMHFHHNVLWHESENIKFILWAELAFMKCPFFICKCICADGSIMLALRK